MDMDFLNSFANLNLTHLSYKFKSYRVLKNNPKNIFYFNIAINEYSGWWFLTWLSEIKDYQEMYSICAEFIKVDGEPAY